MADDINSYNGAVNAANSGRILTPGSFDSPIAYMIYSDEQDRIYSRQRDLSQNTNSNSRPLHSGTSTSTYVERKSVSIDDPAHPQYGHGVIRRNLGEFILCGLIAASVAGVGALFIAKNPNKISDLFSGSLYEENRKKDQLQRSVAVRAVGSGYAPEVTAQLKKLQLEQPKHATAFQVGRLWAVLPPAAQFNAPARLLVCDPGFYMEPKYEISAFSIAAVKPARSGTQVKSTKVDFRPNSTCLQALGPEIQNYYGNVAVKVSPKLVVE